MNAAASIAGEELTLLAERAAYWPRRATLFVADAHFGYVRMVTDVAHSDIEEQRKGMDRDARVRRTRFAYSSACRCCS